MPDGHEPAPAFARTPGTDDVVRVNRTDDVPRIALVGELDLCTVSRARPIVEGACEGRPAEVVLDLSGLEFVDAHGLRLLVETRRRLADRGCPLVIVPPPAHLRRIFVLTGLDELFHVRLDAGPTAEHG